MKIPAWAESCPVAYGKYRQTIDDFIAYGKAHGVPDAVLDRLAVSVACAWAAGQDSITERSR